MLYLRSRKMESRRIELRASGLQGLRAPQCAPQEQVLVPGIEPGVSAVSQQRLASRPHEQEKERGARVELAFPAWKAGA